MKNIFDSVIANGGYDLVSLLQKIDSYHIEGKLTDEEREELYAKARERANVVDSLDVYEKLKDLENRVRQLEEGVVEDEPTTEYPEYVVGKWYYHDDRMTFEGKRYVCTAPKSTVCTWSPTEYPAYWALVE